MPIEYLIDHEAKLVSAKGRGTVTDQEFFDYKHDAWARDDVAGYDELFDMSEVEHVDQPSVDKIRNLASLSASMDAAWGSSKLAIIAPHDLTFGLGRMYSVYREMDTRSRKRVEVFRSAEKALMFLESKA